MTKIAIVGMGCRFPGEAASLEQYWAMLCAGRCAISEIPSSRWSLNSFFDPRPDIPTRSYSKWGGFLDDVTSFDPEFFGLSPREAVAMDPQQRVLLEVAYAATQDAGLTLDNLREKLTGVFVGASNTDYALLQRHRLDRGEILAGTGTALSIVANRVSNVLSLTGPSIVLDTACSSSLVALDTACHNLRSGACDFALAGGANILLDPRMFITFSRAHMLSPTGQIRAFDASADGFVRGEGVGLVLLRRLEDALESGDRIYATIETTAINQDGGTGTITAPNPDAQVAMMKGVRDTAQISPDQLAFAEAHGTGTEVGDPIEANAIGQVFGGAERSSPLLIGSSKTNLGHLEPAAGAAGLIKAVLSLWHGSLPATLGYSEPNPSIDFETHNIEVATRPTTLDLAKDRDYALVNSFGFGGTNACALLRAPEVGQRVSTVVSARAPDIATSKNLPTPCPVSGPTEQHRNAYAHSVSSWLQDEPDTSVAKHSAAKHSAAKHSAVGPALAHQRDHFQHRAVAIAATPEELENKLDAIANGKAWPREHKYNPPGIVTGNKPATGKLAFTMTGQGGQWWAMGRELLHHHDVFRSFFETFDAQFKPVAGWSVIDALLADENESQIDDAAITPAVMFAFQVGLAEIWKSYGVTPDIVVGHSFGEVTAAYLAGAISIDHVAGLVTHRGLIRGEVDRTGNMAAIGLGAEAMQALLPADGSVEIGGYNSPNLVTLTGEEASIDAIIARLNTDDPTIVTKKLALDFAYHSSWFEPVEDVFKSNVGELHWKTPEIPVISTVTGVENTRFDADYWWSNLRYPVRYQDGINRALELGCRTFIELGPVRTLSSMTAGCAAAQGIDVKTISTLHRGWDDFESIATGVAELFCSGHDIDWTGCYTKPVGAPVLPHAPLLTSEHWHAPDEAKARLFSPSAHPFLGRPTSAPGWNWQQTISLETHPVLADHRMNGQIVYPAACYIESIYAAAASALSTQHIEIKALECVAALYIEVGDEIELRTTFDETSGRIQIHSRHYGTQQGWRLRAKARVLPADRHAHPPLDEQPGSTHRAVETATFYDAVRELGYQYGPGFQGLTDVTSGSVSAAAQLECSGNISPEFADLALPPMLLDAALQLMLAPQVSSETAADTQYLPTRFASIIITGQLREGARVRATVRGGVETHNVPSGQKMSASFALTDTTDLPLMTIQNLQAVASRKMAVPGEGDAPAAKVYREQLMDWTREDTPSTDTSSPRKPTWLLVENETVRVTSNLKPDNVQLPSGEASERDTLAERSQRLASQIEQELTTHPDVSGLLYLPVAAKTKQHEQVPFGSIAHQTKDALAFGRAIQQVADMIGKRPVWVLTRNARAFERPAAGPLEPHASERTVKLDHASLTGAFRTVQMECQQLNIRLLDTDDESLDAPDLIAQILNTSSDETEIVVRKARPQAVRLQEQQRDNAPSRTILSGALPDTTNYRLRSPDVSGLHGLRWEAFAEPDETGQPNKTKAGNRIEIEVTHVGLNFRDIMAANHALPDDAEPTPAIEALGLEFAGRVIAKTDESAPFAIGQNVFGMARGVLARRITVSANQVHAVPEGVTAAQAATLCSAYLTSHYALNHIGRLQRGERVLIHNGSGAVGLAAIALCQAAGAEIFTTAGTSEKREHLKQLGITHVYDSRSLAFASSILSDTHGKGVDVVLNALAGPYIDKALDCLAPYGRFLEIGKRDVYADRPVGLRALRANQSFHVIDVAALLHDRPEQVHQIMCDLLPRFASYELKPIPSRVFPARQVVDAFEHFSAAKHIGKVVVECADLDVPVHQAFGSTAAIDPHGTYLVTGGTRGMGRAICQWLEASGAGRIIAVSRSGGASATLPANSNIETRQLDVTDAEAVHDLIKSIEASDKPLKGVIHAAVQYNDALLSDMTDEASDSVLLPKLQGALNLTTAILAMGAKPDMFVSFSSAAAITGWPGQSNYSAANSALETVTHWQRSQGLPAQCIHWGVFGEVGHVADSDAMSSYLSNAGWQALDVSEVCEHLAAVLDTGQAVVTVTSADWKGLAKLNPSIARAPRMSNLLDQAESNAAGRQDFIAVAQAGDASSLALSIVREQVGKVLRMNPESLHDYETIYDAGIDSLSAFELRNRIEQEIGLDIPLGSFMSAVSFEELKNLLCELANEHSAGAGNAAVILESGDNDGGSNDTDAEPRNEAAE